MSSRRRDDGAAAYGVEEITVNMTVRDGKITVESQSGPKGGSVELFVDDSNAKLVFNGSGSDRATARLTGPELANFRTMVDAALFVVCAVLTGAVVWALRRRSVSTPSETPGVFGD